MRRIARRCVSVLSRPPPTIETDVLVVGAGPAGLAAGAALADRGARFVVADEGPELSRRDRSVPRDLVTGVGGAGLWSDGKFSFFPSATALWRLPDRPRLRASFDWLGDVLVAHGDVPRAALPPFPAAPEGATGRAEAANAEVDDFGSWSLKRYPSIYTDLGAREQLVRHLADVVIGRDRFVLGAPATPRWDPAQRVWIASTHSTASTPGAPSEVRAQSLVIAGGRFWPRFADLALESSFRRLEFGVRVEAAATNPFFVDITRGIVDPKLKFSAHGAEFRTFCCCRDGEIVETEFRGLRTLSGRGDVAPSGWSNVGFNVRIEDPALAHDMRRAMPPFPAPFHRVPRSDPRIRAAYGSRGAELLDAGLSELLDAFPALHGHVTLSGPTIEGVGEYPVTDEHLRLRDQALGPACVVGDASGRFRGIVAAMISGHYVGSRL